MVYILCAWLETNNRLYTHDKYKIQMIAFKRESNDVIIYWTANSAQSNRYNEMFKLDLVIAMTLWNRKNLFLKTLVFRN